MKETYDIFQEISKAVGLIRRVGFVPQNGDFYEFTTFLYEEYEKKIGKLKPGDKPLVGVMKSEDVEADNVNPEESTIIHGFNIDLRNNYLAMVDLLKDYAKSKEINVKDSRKLFKFITEEINAQHLIEYIDEFLNNEQEYVC